MRARAYGSSTFNDTSISRGTLGFTTDGEFRRALFTWVIKAEKNGSSNYNKVTLFVNPDLSYGSVENSGLGSASATLDTGVSTLSSFFFRTGTNSPNAAETFLIDSVAVGETWADISAVPEPGTINVLALTGVALIIRRRLRQLCAPET